MVDRGWSVMVSHGQSWSCEAVRSCQSCRGRFCAFMFFFPTSSPPFSPSWGRYSYLCRVRLGWLVGQVQVKLWCHFLGVTHRPFAQSGSWVDFGELGLLFFPPYLVRFRGGV